MLKLKFFCAVFILAIGSIGILISPSAKSIDFNKTQLAQRIRANEKLQKRNNQNLIKKFKKKQKKEKQSKLVRDAKKAVKSIQLIRSMSNMAFLN